ncbi:MAG: helix-turn-helix transcriptional regulator [Bryobacterales bacterium]|nr:helix-turn-helix transcriptional regulator [Bryobacterales bacterium]
MSSAKRQIRTSDPVTREILIGFWKVHILYHAAEGPIYGQWIAEELRRHGYAISPGTLYPLLRRMEAHGWLRSSDGENGRKEYRLTANGRRTLALLRKHVAELHGEVSEHGRDA